MVRRTGAEAGAAGDAKDALVGMQRALTELVRHRFSGEDLTAFEYDLQQAGIMPLPLEAIIPRYRFALGDYVLGPTDYHPNARAHRLIAEFILREIRPDK